MQISLFLVHSCCITNYLLSPVSNGENIRWTGSGFIAELDDKPRIIPWLNAFARAKVSSSSQKVFTYHFLLRSVPYGYEGVLRHQQATTYDMLCDEDNRTNYLNSESRSRPCIG